MKSLSQSIPGERALGMRPFSVSGCLVLFALLWGCNADSRQLMEQAENVIEQRLLQIQTLEESGDALLALSDYVQRRISEDRDKGRYMRPD